MNNRSDWPAPKKRQINNRRDAINAIEDQLKTGLEVYLTTALSEPSVLRAPILEALSRDEVKALFDSLQHHMRRILENELDGLDADQVLRPR